MKSIKKLKNMSYKELKEELKEELSKSEHYIKIINCVIKRYLTRLYFTKKSL